MGFFSGLGSALIGGAANLLGGVLQNNSAKSQAREQMAFQENMSNTSYQRAMEDMRLAGLNPILAAKTGGASTPSGAAAPIENVVGPAVNSALQTRMNVEQVNNLATQNEQIRASTKKTQAETDLIKQTTQFGSVVPRLGGSTLIDSVKALISPIVKEENLKPLSSSAKSIGSGLSDIFDSDNYSLKNASQKFEALKDYVRSLPDPMGRDVGFRRNSAKSELDFRGMLKPPKYNER